MPALQRPCRFTPAPAPRPPVKRRAVGFLLALASSVAAAVAAPHPTQTPVPFRASVLLVPVDVRVIDARGRPVTDLTAADFTVFDNGVRQQTVHFALQAHPAPGPSEGGEAASAPTRRTFFLLLGRGRLNVPDRGVDALMDFVRSLPAGDRVGVFAYLHLSEPTTDHEAVVRLLERFRAQQEVVEERLEADFVRALGAPAWALSPRTQAAIQAMFEAPGLPPVRRFPGAAGGRGLAFSDRIALGRILEYLGQVEGEKHLLLLVDGTGLRSGLDTVAATAAAARVSVSVVQTGGVPAGRPGALWAPPSRSSGVFDVGSSAVDVAGLRALARQTGGTATFYQDAGDAFARLSRVLSGQYVLGYYPAVPPRDGELRRLRVVVNRRGLTVLHRHVYEARPSPAGEPVDLRALFAESRFRSLLGSPAPSSDVAPAAWATIPTTISATRIRGAGGTEQVRVALAIDPRWVTFTREGDQYRLSLNLAVAAQGAGDTPLGQTRDRLDLCLDAEAYSRLVREPVRHTVTLDVTGQPAEVKVVVYEYDSDRSALATRRLRQRLDPTGRTAFQGARPGVESAPAPDGLCAVGTRSCVSLAGPDRVPVTTERRGRTHQGNRRGPKPTG